MGNTVSIGNVVNKMANLSGALNTVTNLAVKSALGAGTSQTGGGLVKLFTNNLSQAQQTTSPTQQASPNLQTTVSTTQSLSSLPKQTAITKRFRL